MNQTHLSEIVPSSQSIDFYGGIVIHGHHGLALDDDVKLRRLFIVGVIRGDDDGAAFVRRHAKGVDEHGCRARVE